MIFSYHPWFYQSIEEEGTDDVRDNDPTFIPTIPKGPRKKFLTLARHHKVKLVHCSATAPIFNNYPLRPFGKTDSQSNTAVDSADIQVAVNAGTGDAGNGNDPDESPGKAEEPSSDNEVRGN